MDLQAAMTRLRTFVVRRRHELRLTQAELAAVSGLSKPTISRLEQGTLASLPKLASIDKLAKGLQVPPDELQNLVTKGGVDPIKARTRALIAFGDESLRRLLVQGLCDADLAAVAVGTGDAAIEVIHYAEPGVLVLDEDLPGISAKDLLQFLRRDQGYRGTVVIIADPERWQGLPEVSPGTVVSRDEAISVSRLAEQISRLIV